MSDSFLQRVLDSPSKWCTYSDVWLLHGWCHVKFGAFCVHHTTMHHVTSLHAKHIRRVHTCLVVTSHLHCWQNDRGLLCATAVTRGWNGYRNKSQHIKLTLDKKILPPLLFGFESETFRSRVPAVLGGPLNRQRLQCVWTDSDSSGSTVSVTLLPLYRQLLHCLWQWLWCCCTDSSSGLHLRLLLTSAHFFASMGSWVLQLSVLPPKDFNHTQWAIVTIFKVRPVWPSGKALGW